MTGDEASPEAVADAIDRLIADAETWMRPRPGVSVVGLPVPDYMVRDAEEAGTARDNAVQGGKTVATSLVRLGESARAAFAVVNALEAGDTMQARKDWPALKVELQETAARLRIKAKAMENASEPCHALRKK